MLDGEDTNEVVDESTSQTDDTSSTQQDSATQEDAGTKQTVEAKPTDSEPDILKTLDGLAIDPKLKEALKAGHLRQADYTRKTQELASDRKLIDEYKQVRPILEFLEKNPTLFNEVFQKMQGQQQPQKDGQEQIPDDPKEYAEWVKANTIKEMLAIQAQEQDFQRAAKVDPRLDADPEFGEMVAKLVANDPEFRGKQINAEQATAKAVKFLDSYIKRQVTTDRQNLSERAKAKRLGSVGRALPGSAAGKSQPKTILEAAQMAEEEMGS